MFGFKSVLEISFLSQRSQRSTFCLALCTDGVPENLCRTIIPEVLRKNLREKQASTPAKGLCYPSRALTSFQRHLADRRPKAQQQSQVRNKWCFLCCMLRQRYDRRVQSQ